MTNDSATPLRRWLDQQGVSVEELARRCGVSLGTMSVVARGKRRPTDALKMKIHEQTRSLEKDKGYSPIRGVEPADWFVQYGGAGRPISAGRARRPSGPPKTKSPGAPRKK